MLRKLFNCSLTKISKQKRVVTPYIATAKAFSIRYKTHIKKSEVQNKLLEEKKYAEKLNKIFEHEKIDRVESQLKKYADFRTEEVPDKIGSYYYKSTYKFQGLEDSAGFYVLYRAHESDP